MLAVTTCLPVSLVDLKVACHIVEVHCNGLFLQVVDAFDTDLGVLTLLYFISSVLGF